MRIDELVQRRKTIGEKMETGSVLVSFSGDIVRYSNDMEYPFQVSRNFYYLTGIDQPGAILVLYKNDQNLMETLFIARKTANELMFSGPQMSFEQYRASSGISSVLFVEEMEGFLDSLMMRRPFHIWYMADGTIGQTGETSPEKRYALKMRSRYPELVIKNLDYEIRNLRLVKSGYEQETIREAIRLTGLGIEAVMSEIRPGLHEYDMAALFEYTVRRNGSEKPPFLITAGGENIFAMHYTGDRKQLQDGEFFLIDCGAQVEHYCADITRTFPVNGRFTERQRYWYQVCLQVQEMTIRELRPGTARGVIGNPARQYLADIFRENGYDATPETLRNMNDRAYAFVGQANHSFGLDAHELGEDILLPGMIYTVEPNIFIREEKIGLRIEDNILITENGPVNLSASIPRTVEEIEKAMNKESYGRAIISTDLS